MGNQSFEGIAKNGVSDHARESRPSGGELRAEDMAENARETLSAIKLRVAGYAFGDPSSSSYMRLAESYLVAHPGSSKRSAQANAHRLMRAEGFRRSAASAAERAGAGFEVRLEARRSVLSGEYRRETVTQRTAPDGSVVVEKRSSTPTGAERLRAASDLDRALGWDDERRTAHHAERSAIDLLIKNVSGKPKRGARILDNESRYQ